MPNVLTLILIIILFLPHNCPRFLTSPPRGPKPALNLLLKSLLNLLFLLNHFIIKHEPLAVPSPPQLIRFPNLLLLFMSRRRFKFINILRIFIVLLQFNNISIFLKFLVVLVLIRFLFQLSPRHPLIIFLQLLIFLHHFAHKILLFNHYFIRLKLLLLEFHRNLDLLVFHLLILLQPLQVLFRLRYTLQKPNYISNASEEFPPKPAPNHPRFTQLSLNFPPPYARISQHRSPAN